MSDPEDKGTGAGSSIYYGRQERELRESLTPPAPAGGSREARAGPEARVRNKQVREEGW